LVNQVVQEVVRAATRKRNMEGQKYFRGANVRLGGQKYTKYNKRKQF